MISANISKAIRKEVYQRDGWRCALCDDSRTKQIHHYIPRGKGGTDNPENLITLCSNCHALAHGINLNPEYDDVPTREDIEQAILEYLADYYAVDGWNPY